jgi:signal transduction histidine kinase
MEETPGAEKHASRAVLRSESRTESRSEPRIVASAQAEPPRMLTTVNEGLFFLNGSLVIGPGHSPVLTEILRRKEFTGVSFRELLTDIVPGDTLKTALDFVAQLASGRIGDESIQSTNPLKEVAVYFGAQAESFETRYLKFDFRRTSATGQLPQVLVAVTDITEPVRLRLELQQAQAASAAQMDLLMSILHVAPDQLQSFLSEAESAINQANSVLKQPATEEAEFRAKLSDLFTSVHGIRRSAGVLRLPTVEARTHAFEDDLQVLRGKSELSGFDMLELPIKLAELLSHFGAIRALLARIAALRSAFAAAPAIEDTGETADTVTIAVPDFSNMEPSTPEIPEPVDAAQATVEPQQLAQPVEAAAPVTAPEQPQPAPDSIAQTVSNLSARVARDLGKEIRVEASGLEHLPADYHRDVKSILIQLARNAVAHGIETPEQRKSSGKPAVGTIRIELEPDRQASVYHLQVEDDGCGFSADRIRAAAVSKGLVTSDEARQLDGRKLVALLFEPGFSAFEDTKTPGGHGVGMDLVKSIVDRLGGRIGVAGKPGQYSRYRITLPLRDSSAVAA